MGKGDTPRPVDKEKYDDNYRRVFGDKPLNVWKDAPGREPEAGQGDRQSNGEQDEGCGGPSCASDHEPVEGKRSCPNCPGGTIGPDPHWPDRDLCEKCQSNWPRGEGP
jgi:hypothetical protein